MNFHVPASSTQAASDSRRQPPDADRLILDELNPQLVVDQLDGEQATLALLTFGTMREVCPKCQQSKLKLVLRQNAVRVAHLFCAECESCFDARYANGSPALSI